MLTLKFPSIVQIKLLLHQGRGGGGGYDFHAVVANKGSIQAGGEFFTGNMWRPLATPWPMY